MLNLFQENVQHLLNGFLIIKALCSNDSLAIWMEHTKLIENIMLSWSVITNYLLIVAEKVVTVIVITITIIS